jgi:hypothetical protein
VVRFSVTLTDPLPRSLPPPVSQAKQHFLLPNAELLQQADPEAYNGLASARYCR